MTGSGSRPGSMEDIVHDATRLRGVFVTVMPDGLLYDSWVRDDEWSAEQVAVYFGDMVRANRAGLRALRSWSADMKVTIESPESLIVLREVAHDFVVALIFEADAPLGNVRLQSDRLCRRIESVLPSFDVEERPRGVRITEFLHRYAPDPHAVMLRVALRTGIGRDLLERPAELVPEQILKVEEAACAILGLRELNV